MAFRNFNAYLDETQIITIDMPQFFDVKGMSFTLEHHIDDEIELIDLEIEVSFSQDNLVIYRLVTSDIINLEDNYILYDQDRNASTLMYRNIVRTKYFDEHYFYSGSDLGANYFLDETIFKLWAPLSKAVYVVIKKENHQQVFVMDRQAHGVWEVAVNGNLDGVKYHYLHLVNGKWQQVHDPYAIASDVNSGDSFVIDKAKLLNVNHKVQRANKQIPIEKAIIYEMSVRDFTSLPSANFKARGQFLGLTESPIIDGISLGQDYLKHLNITHIQLMPIYDFGSVDEAHPSKVYNWGYDPMQYNVPEGSFSSDPTSAYARIIELQLAIDHYHKADLSVIMDVVYNHVYDVDSYAFEKIVPGYCYRVDWYNNKTNGTFCGNDIATERKMMRQYIKHSLRHWLTLYGVDGFRFDLMGILDIQTMNEISEELQREYSNVYLYGEGWQMNTGLDNRYLAHQFNSYQMPSIGFFNDDFRETIKNVLINCDSIPHQKIEEVLSGSIGLTTENGRYLTASQSINYVECHDNHTLFDFLQVNNHQLSVEDRIKLARFALEIQALSQGILFIHSGQEFFRTKNNIDNSYNLPDSINQLDWQRAVTYYENVKFVSQLFALRQKYSQLTLSTHEQIKANCHFYWLTPHVLRYQIVEPMMPKIEIIINFGNTSYHYTPSQHLVLKMCYPYINTEDRDDKIVQDITISAHQCVLLIEQSNNSL